MTKQRKMVNLAVDETSGVDHPAHLHEGWVVFKNTDNEGVIDAIVGQIDESTEGENIVSEEIIEEVVEEVVAKTEHEDEMGKLRKKISELEDALAKAVAPAKEDDSEETMMKSAPPAVVALLVKARKDAEIVAKELHDVKAAQRDSEFVAKAREFDHLAIDVEEFGPALRAVADQSPVLADMMVKALASANAQAESAAIFGELGHGLQADTGKAYEKVQSLAKAAVNKGTYATVEQAIVGLISDDPTLYEQYRNEQNA